MADLESTIVPLGELKSTLKAIIPRLSGIVAFGNANIHNIIELNADIPYLKVDIPGLINEPVFEIWFSQRPVWYGSTSNFKYSTNGSTMFICNKEIEQALTLQDTSFNLYNELFTHVILPNKHSPIRMWNYLPLINQNEPNYSERYKAFCKGRSEAFIKNNILDNYPAATTVGSLSGNLNVCCLSSNISNLTYIENPEQTPAYNYPANKGFSAPKFSRALFQLHNDDKYTLYISGTASIIGHQSVFPENVEQQFIQTIKNIQHLISYENLSNYGLNYNFSLESLQYIKVYLRHSNDYPVAMKLCQNIFSSNTKIACLNAHICRKELLVEIEGIISS